jgi:hypothetical protein
MTIKANVVLSGILCFVASLTFFPQTAPAQDQQDPPSRVARLGYIEGSVSFQAAGEQDWVQADPDRPLTVGDSLWVDQNSRGELHVGGTALRLGSQTGISFLNLNEAVQVQLAQGTLFVHVRRINPNDAYEIDTPNLAFTIASPGDYRLDADPNGNTTAVTVFSGQGTVTGAGQNWNVTPGQRAVFNGANQLAYSVQPIANDTFDSWARSREMREEHLEAARYCSPDMTGYEDLDQYGTWRTDPQYGAYWLPNGVDADWAPYHEGHWVWVAPWGWTWVDAEPWGFAPFHYGRWAIIGNGWGWVPGPVAETEVYYAPALVGFVGGGGFGVSIGFGAVEGVAWFPLGPRDVYVPPYAVSQRYVEQVNVSNTTVINRTTITNVYNNYTVNHVTNVNYTYANNTRAVMAVNRQAFVSGAPVAKAAIQVNAQEIQHPQVITAAVLTPTRASVVGAAAITARAVPPRTLAARRVVTKMAPAPQATPLGRPRPQMNPNLSAATVNRAGFSQQAQRTRAAAAAKAEVVPTANRPAETQPGRSATRPNEARPNEPQPSARKQPGRPVTPPRETGQPERQPNRPATPPNETPRRPEAQPGRPATPPNETRQPEVRKNRPASPPNARRRPEAQPSRPETPPSKTRHPETQPSRPATPPSEQRRLETEKPKTVTPPQQAKRPATPPKEVQKPKEKDKPKPKPEPQLQFQL